MTDHHGDAGGPLDRVSVTGIRARGFHGVLDHEKRDGQEFSCDVSMYLSVARAARSDDLRDAVDYSVVARKAHDVLTGPSLDLVESVAQRIAVQVLADDRVRAVEVVVHKPQAPVGVPFDDVSVRVLRTQDDLAADTPPPGPVRAVLALGANLGDAHDTLHRAVLDLAAVEGVTVLGSSPVVDSAPVGGPEQGRYLNAVLLVETTLSPLGLLVACQQVEAEHGRTREVRWGPRTLDVDVVSVRRPDGSDLDLRTPDLDLPHPRAAGRRFVLLPWSLLDPRSRLLDLDRERPVSELLDELVDDDDVVVRTDLTLPFALPRT